MVATPLVSVIINFFNGEVFLPLAVDSILQQSFSDFELIIVDDASTDRTREQLESIKDPRVRVIRNDQNLGPGGARNVGIDAAGGVFCAFLDHDDVALPFRLHRQVTFLQSNPSVGLVGSAIEVIDAAGKKLATIKMPEAPLAIQWMGLLDCPMRQSSLMGRTEVVKRHRYADLPNYSDWDFVMRVAREAEVRNLPDTFIQYRRHATNITKLFGVRLDDIGIDLALREIRTELPEFAISRHEVAELRAVLFGTQHGAEKKSLEISKRALERYLDLENAFRQKHGIM
ncbi:MAG: glycosyltransferase family 2 protein [Chthoniobacterales bacterium]